MSEDKNTKKEVIDQEADEGRREALKKLGKYAYTAPVVLSLLSSSKNADAELPALPSFPANP